MWDMIEDLVARCRDVTDACRYVARMYADVSGSIRVQGTLRGWLIGEVGRRRFHHAIIMFCNTQQSVRRDFPPTATRFVLHFTYRGAVRRVILEDAMNIRASDVEL